MNYTTTSCWGPDKTPSLIKQLLLWVGITAILSAGVQSALEQFGIFPGPQNYLSLSCWGLKNGYLWQLLTFLFIQEAPNGLSFPFFITLLFHLYLLWVIGSTVLHILGKGPFLRLYFLGGMTAGIFALLTMQATGQYSMIEGMSSTLLILMTVWSMAFPETEVLLFFLIPFKVKWIVTALIGAMLLISLSHADFATFVLNLSAVAIGYGYAVVVQGWYSPFPFTLPFDRKLSRIGMWVRTKIPLDKGSREKKTTPKTRIVDMETGQPLQDDDAFIDAMLAKISQKGESALSWSEKKRMQEISKKKMRK